LHILAALRYELGDHHSYEFVEGTIPWPIAPEIASLFDPDDDYFAYFDANVPASVQDAINQLREYILAEGPFDGIIGFSQGAGLAAMYLVQQAHAKMSPIKCAIFLSSFTVYDPVAFQQQGVIRKLDPMQDGVPIQIPTVHIWGEREGGSEDSERLRDLCNQSLASTFIHEGGHEVPGLGAKGAVTGIVKVVRRGLSKANSM